MEKKLANSVSLRKGKGKGSVSANVDFLFAHNWMNTYKKPTIGNGLFPPTKVILPNKKQPLSGTIVL